MFIQLDCIAVDVLVVDDDGDDDDDDDDDADLTSISNTTHSKNNGIIASF